MIIFTENLIKTRCCSN